MKKISKKVVLAGNFGVGKTSLVRKFVYQKFSDEYLSTLGVKIDRKVLHIGDTELTLVIWDIAGEVNGSKIPTSYFLGASGLIYVIDLSRPSTYANVQEEITYLEGLMEDVSICLIANKLDLVEAKDLTHTQQVVKRTIDFFTSAKTGENVNEMFYFLARKLLQVPT
ncbi:MAG: GTP-binding protein [Microscillaceae bacterium]|nr:GTP-binding protein [Microscillaceae bacterium]MDW8461198.1 Rab family GTPase [Cytophagales bacterium]